MRKITLLFVSLLLAGAQMLQAQRTVTGTVVADSDKQGIPGVSVKVKGTNTGTSTDINGRFNLNVPTGANTLVFSYVGMEQQEIAIDDKTTIDIVMSTASTSLEGVVVTGYGNIKKSTYTGSAEVVSSEIIDRVQSSNVSKSLEGVVPGVQVTGNSGQPGSGMNIRIRGVGSVSASNEPLYVVDGAPFDGYISSINPDDIENISLLKDATSAALYGARGANGVVLITTKRGRSGEARLNFKATVGIVTRGLKEYDLVDQAGYYEAKWLSLRNSYMTDADNPVSKALAGQMASGLAGEGYSVIEKLGGYNCFKVPNNQLIDPVTGKVNPNAELLWDDNWQDELLQKGIRQDYQFSASKGDDKNNIFASLSYADETGITPNTGFNRLTARLNSNNQLKKWGRLEMGISGTHQKTTNMDADGSISIVNPFAFVRNMPSIYPVYLHDPITGELLLQDGQRQYDWGNAEDGQQPGTDRRPYNPGYNLLASIPLDYSGAQVEALSARTAFEVKIIDGLTFRIAGNADVANNYSVGYYNSKFGEYKNVNGLLSRAQGKTFSYTLTEMLTYAKQIGDHNFSVMAGHEAYAFNYQYLSASKQNFPFETLELALGADLKSITSYHDNYNLEGIFASASYDYQGKYYISGSYRRDGSSRFHPSSRWGNFWSVGGAWILTRENFLASQSDWLNVLKFKISYGSQGNDQLSSYYPWQGLFNMTYKNGSNPGALHTSLDNPDLKWESQRMFNTGLDFRLFRRVSGSVEYYVRNNVDMLFNKPLPASSGLRSIAQNIGEMRSSGVEAQLNFDLIETKNVRWTLGINGTHWNNKIVKLAPSDSLGIAATGNKRIQEGHSIYEFYLKDYAGVDKNTGEATYYMGENRDSITKDLNQASFYFMGNSIPKFYGGLSSTVEFYGFDFSFIISYAIGGQVLDNSYIDLMHGGNGNNNWHKDIFNSWSVDNTDSDLPELNEGRASNNNGISSRFLIKGSYINLKNITLGYTLPHKLTKKIHIENVRAFVSADNFFLKSARQGLDPQQSLGGVTVNSYYPTKTLTFGLTVQF